MKRITEISQLAKGDIIVAIADHKVVKREFVCVHPHNDKYSLFLDELQNGCPKFYNENLKFKEWYLYNDTKTERREVAVMRMEKLKQEIEKTKAFLNECK